MLRAWFWGVGILLILSGAWVIALQAEVFSAVLLLGVQISPFVAAVASAYLAPQKKVIIAVSMAIPATVITVAVTVIYQLFGVPVDFPGFRGGLIISVVTLLYSVFLCWLGGVLGSFLAKRKQMKADA
jgi:hypothetical protein